MKTEESYFRQLGREVGQRDKEERKKRKEEKREERKEREEKRKRARGPLRKKPLDCG